MTNKSITFRRIRYFSTALISYLSEYQKEKKIYNTPASCDLKILSSGLFGIGHSSFHIPFSMFWTEIGFLEITMLLSLCSVFCCKLTTDTDDVNFDMVKNTAVVIILVDH